MEPDISKVGSDFLTLRVATSSVGDTKSKAERSQAIESLVLYPAFVPRLYCEAQSGQSAQSNTARVHSSLTKACTAQSSQTQHNIIWLRLL